MSRLSSMSMLVLISQVILFFSIDVNFCIKKEWSTTWQQINGLIASNNGNAKPLYACEFNSQCVDIQEYICVSVCLFTVYHIHGRVKLKPKENSQTGEYETIPDHYKGIVAAGTRLFSVPQKERNQNEYFRLVLNKPINAYQLEMAKPEYFCSKICTVAGCLTWSCLFVSDF